jgi:uncharacterized membrane protein (UPF0127 family)
MTYKILNKSKETTVAKKALVAQSFFQRLVGLMFRKSMDHEEGLIFYNAPSIHMFFMYFPIDVVFLDKDMRVIKVCPALAPWKMASCFKSYITIELPTNKALETLTERGDILEFVPA